MIIKRVTELNHHQLLNLDPSASGEQIKRAYIHLKSVYSSDSVASYGAISDKERQWILEKIDEAYNTLISGAGQAGHDIAKPKLAVNEQVTPPAPSLHGNGSDSGSINKPTVKRSEPSGDALTAQLSGRTISGANLRDIRRAKGASLEEISEVTKVKIYFLEAIEKQDVDNFAAPVFMKGYLKAYAKALALDPAEILDKYMAEE
jgi:DnaJ-class molecular chaperone